MQQTKYFPQTIYSASEESDNSAIELDAGDIQQQWHLAKRRSLRQHTPISRLSKRELEILKLLIEGPIA